MAFSRVLILFEGVIDAPGDFSKAWVAPPECKRFKIICKVENYKKGSVSITAYNNFNKYSIGDKVSKSPKIKSNKTWVSNIIKDIFIVNTFKISIKGNQPDYKLIIMVIWEA